MRTQVNVRAAKAPVLATELKLAGSDEFAVGRYAGSGKGELNASSKRDLLEQQRKFLTAASQGNMLAISKSESRDLIRAAFNSPEAHRVLGEKISESLYITANRQGFMRKYLAKIDVEMGSIPRFPLRNKNVTAVWSTSPTKVESQITRDKWFTPPELTVVARPFIPQVELNQSSGDVLQEKYIEAVEATMVAEDRLYYSQLQALVGVDNNLTIVSGQLTPYSLMTVVTNVTRWGLKGAHLLMATDLWQDVVGNSDFFTAIDPVARHELLLTGELGTMYGMTVTSDAFRHPEHKVLNQGEFFVISDALNHGAYSDRGGLQSTPIDISIEKIPGRGFVLHEALAVSVANSRSFAKGYRM
jgi:hypothetical protein